MARVPEGAELIVNPSSGAPGVKMGNVYHPRRACRGSRLR